MAWRLLFVEIRAGGGVEPGEGVGGCGRGSVPVGLNACRRVDELDKVGRKKILFHTVICFGIVLKEKKK
jgi:hypothetical protein